MLKINLISSDGIIIIKRNAKYNNICMVIILRSLGSLWASCFIIYLKVINIIYLPIKVFNKYHAIKHHRYLLKINVIIIVIIITIILIQKINFSKKEITFFLSMLIDFILIFFIGV